MFLHEYQAKNLLSRFDFPFPAGKIALSAENVGAIASQIQTDSWVVKAQILAGDRGRFGGIKMAHNIAEVSKHVRALFGTTLFTPQTGDEGQEVTSVYIEQGLEIERELYLAILVDRFEGELVLLASDHGGSGVESFVNQSGRLQRLQLEVDQSPSVRELTPVAKSLGLSENHCSKFIKICQEMHRAINVFDALMIELNPLAITDDDQLTILDVKMEIDDNAMFRHSEVEDIRTNNLETNRKMRAQSGFNYVRLKGDVGLLVGGAGLALATMDLLHQHGCKCANFLDLPPIATRTDVENSCYTILQDRSIKTLFVNIVGGGLTHCDTVAEGLITVERQSPLPFPVIVRFAGTKKEHGITLLKNSRMPFHIVDSMTDAVKLAMKIVS